MKSYFLQDKYGQIKEAHSISAGLDYPGVGPEHAFLKDRKRVKYSTVTDEEAIKAFLFLSKLEGIIPALESSHALAYLIKNSKKFSKGFYSSCNNFRKRRQRFEHSKRTFR